VRYSAALRQWAIPITAPDHAQGRQLGGVIAVSIDPFYFSQFFEEVDLAATVLSI